MSKSDTSDVCVCVCFVRDAIPSCNTDDFVKEASEVPDFLEEVEKCRKMFSTDAEELPGESQCRSLRNAPRLPFLHHVLCRRTRTTVPRSALPGNRISSSNEDQECQRHFS